MTLSWLVLILHSYTVFLKFLFQELFWIEISLNWGQVKQKSSQINLCFRWMLNDFIGEVYEEMTSLLLVSLQKKFRTTLHWLYTMFPKLLDLGSVNWQHRVLVTYYTGLPLYRVPTQMSRIISRTFQDIFELISMTFLPKKCRGNFKFQRNGTTVIIPISNKPKFPEMH